MAPLTCIKVILGIEFTGPGFATLDITMHDAGGAGDRVSDKTTDVRAGG